MSNCYVFCFLGLALNLFIRIHVEIFDNSIWAFWIRLSTLVDVTVIWVSSVYRPILESTRHFSVSQEKSNLIIVERREPRHKPCEMLKVTVLAPDQGRRENPSDGATCSSQKGIARANNKPLTSTHRKAIKLRTKLKNKFNKCKTEIHFGKYRKQRNQCANLRQRANLTIIKKFAKMAL